MNPAVGKSIVMLIGLLAVFPCGMALTALGGLLFGAARAWLAGTLEFRTLPLLGVYVLWSIAGVIGFVSLVQSADSLLVARRRLTMWELLGLTLGVLAGGLFAYTCLHHPSSGPLLKAAYFLAPVIGFLLFLLNIHYALRNRPNP